MAERHTVVRTDMMDGIAQNPAVVSLRFYSDGGTYETTADVDNGVIADIKDGLEDGQREIYKAAAASAESKLEDMVLIDSVEINYDERMRNLHDFYNEAGAASRGYRLQHRNIFSETAEGFEGDPPAKGDTVGIGTDGKLKKDGSPAIGKCIHIEKKGPYTYYAIQVSSEAAGG